MSDSVRTAACIVIFHPEIGRLLRSIESVIGQVDEVLLILNSEKKEIEDILRQYSSIVLLGKEENEGIAKAINYAIEYCYAEGIEWLLTLDQDSICPYNLVNRYMDVIDENIGIVTCGIEYNGQMVKTEDQCNDIEECIQSGSFMNVKVANELGGMDSKMFIDQVDFEYCYRLRKAGYRIIQVPGLTLEHSLGDLKIKIVGPITFYIGNHSSIRKYYMARNALYCNLIHPEWRSKTFCIKKISGLIIKSLLFEQDKRNKIKAVFKGIVDAHKMLQNK